MAVFRVPYTQDPERRRALFEKALHLMGHHGTCEGTPEAGTFQGHTPIGRFAGSYRATDETGEIEIEVERKPFLVPLSLIEHEARKFLSTP